MNEKTKKTEWCPSQEGRRTADDRDTLPNPVARVESESSGAGKTTLD
jgi:hypothetical protein